MTTELDLDGVAAQSPLAMAELAKLRTDDERLRSALDAAAYALFQIKRMTPEAVRAFATAEHAKACAGLDEVTPNINLSAK